MNLVGRRVKLFLINSLSAEGLVHSWDDFKVFLISNQKQLVINNPNSNIIMYYVFDANLSCDTLVTENKDLKEEFASKSDSAPVLGPDDQGQDLTELNASLKLRKIADLKIMAANAQREQIRKQLTTFHSINTDQISGKYGTPSFINPQYSSSKEVDNGNATHPGVMSKMSRQESE